MTIQVNGEQAFSIPVENFAISGTNTAYTLNYSVDGVLWSEVGDEVPAQTQTMVLNGVKGMFYKLAGNNNEVTVIC